MSQRFVVVGGGLAAAKAVEEFRSAGFAGPLVMFGAEHHLPYERPPLSKGYLLGNDDLESVFVHDPEWYDDNDVDLRLGTAVTAIDHGQARLVRTGRQPAVLRPAAHRDGGLAASSRDGRRLWCAGRLPPHHRGQPEAQEGVRRGAFGRRRRRRLDRPGDGGRCPGGRLGRHGARVAGPAAAPGARSRGRAGVRRPAPRARRRPAHRRGGHRRRAGRPAGRRTPGGWARRDRGPGGRRGRRRPGRHARRGGRARHRQRHPGRRAPGHL